MDLGQCPHCGRPGLFPNKELAETEEETRALERRYSSALLDATKRAADAKVADFEKATAASAAVIARSLKETERLAESEYNGYATFYRLYESEVRLPHGEKWDVLRRVTDAALFGAYARNIRFAALSIDNKALWNYGSCSWVLRDDMIAHRASAFEENSVLFMENQDILLARANELPLGYRSNWNGRAKLCVAKLAKKITRDTKTESFPQILLRNGSDTCGDDFVEVHVGGSISIRTLTRIVIMTRRPGQKRAIARALKRNLERFGVELEF